MKYSNFEIKNFRGIKSLKFEGFGNVNLIVGKNNASKTSILESLFVLSGSLTPEIILRVNLFRSLKFIEQDDFRLIFNSLKYDESIFLKAINVTGEEHREVEIQPKFRDSKTLTVPKNMTNDRLISLDSFYYSNNSSINELVFNTKSKERHKQEKKATARIYYTNGDFVTENSPLRLNEYQQAVYVSQNLNLSANLEKELEDLLITKQHHQIVEVLKTIDNSIVNISLGHNRMIYVDTGMERLIPVNLLGDGIRRLLSIILAIYNARDGFVLIDEIDNGLHFSALKSLWKSVIKIANDVNVQVFVTTHNYETIKYLSECLQEEDYEKYQSSVKTFTVRKLKDGIHKSYGYDFSQFTNAVDEDIELR